MASRGWKCSTGSSARIFNRAHFYYEIVSNVLILTALLIVVSLATGDWSSSENGIEHIVPQASAGVYMFVCMWFCVFAYFGLSVLVNPKDFTPFKGDEELCSNCGEPVD
eukprot:CAMPEP_0184677468 /NCGR_PEP_ID=MMETSP0312-20130426/58_1 /TAXON_ID=31354 /ORGANISM="Compsopogon coeruleus, Strain SAG 36.94" /LENGTH=108 /DNA_ID=CAMNT_0027125375 /DNA_START=279 /DNA_END=605 /DNA_ORIENTATION=+